MILQPHRAGSTIRSYGLYCGADLADGDHLTTCSWDVPDEVTLVDSGVNSSVLQEFGAEYPANTVAWMRVTCDTPGDYACLCEVHTAQGDVDTYEMLLVVR